MNTQRSFADEEAADDVRGERTVHAAAPMMGRTRLAPAIPVRRTIRRQGRRFDYQRLMLALVLMSLVGFVLVGKAFVAYLGLETSHTLVLAAGAHVTLLSLPVLLWRGSTRAAQVFAGLPVVGHAGLYVVGLDVMLPGVQLHADTLLAPAGIAIMLVAVLLTLGPQVVWAEAMNEDD